MKDAIVMEALEAYIESLKKEVKTLHGIIRDISDDIVCNSGNDKQIVINISCTLDAYKKLYRKAE